MNQFVQILLLEDSSAERKLYSRVLKQRFRQVYVAASGHTAISILEEIHDPDVPLVLISDLEMDPSGGTGRDFLVYAGKFCSNYATMIISGTRDPRLITRIADLGIVSYYYKGPWDEEKFFDSVHRTVEAACEKTYLQQLEDDAAKSLELEASKMQTVATAHDAKNLLSVLNLALDGINEAVVDTLETPDDPGPEQIQELIQTQKEVCEYLAPLEEISKELKDCLQEIYSPVNRKEFEWESFDVNVLLATLTSRLTKAWSGNINFQESYEAKRFILANQRMIRRMWLNLISNSVKALTRSGSQVEIASRDLNPVEAQALFGGAEGLITGEISQPSFCLRFGNLNKNYVLISLKDNGPGIRLNTLKNFGTLFGPGSKGSCGVGLYSVGYVVKLCEGLLRINTDRNKGTEFLLAFPAGYEIDSEDGA
jgi:signal transduction histidine kinase